LLNYVVKKYDNIISGP